LTQRPTRLVSVAGISGMRPVGLLLRRGSSDSFDSATSGNRAQPLLLGLDQLGSLGVDRQAGRLARCFWRK